MLLVLLFSFIVAHVAGQDQLLRDYHQPFTKDVDYSSAKACYVYGGKLDRVSQQFVEMGHQCVDARLDAWTADEAQAKEYCESRFPYYVTEAKPDTSSLGGTLCTFRIHLYCDHAYTQIKGKCYMVTDSIYTLEKAKTNCTVLSKGKEGAQLAQYYTSNLALYLDQIAHIYDAWVTVPEVKDYFPNGVGNAAVYVQDGAHKYDVEKGSIILDKSEAKHQALCEYTPPMTMAEMFYIADIYSEIYPIDVYNGGAVLSTSNYMTIKQTGLGRKDVPLISVDHFNGACMNIGKILNVESFPMTALEEEYNDVKNSLKDHNFYLTNAFKEDGQYKEDFRQKNEKGTRLQIYTSAVNSDPSYNNSHSFCFHPKGRFPTMAGMRAPLLCALHTFNWAFDNCPQEQGFESPVTVTRKDNRVFCHYVKNDEIVERGDAVQACTNIGASLTGYDSEEEYLKIKEKMKPQYPPNSLPRYWNNILVEHHYWLGGRSPCDNTCAASGPEYLASWENGVAVNVEYLNVYQNHEGYDWANPDNHQMWLAFRNDVAASHIHYLTTPYKYMFYVCGKTAPLKRTAREKGTLVNTG